MEPEDVLSVTQAAKESGYQVRTIHKAIREGRLQSMVLIGKIAITKDALTAFMAQKGKRRPGAGRPRKEQTNG